MRHLTAKGIGVVVGLVLCFGMMFSGALLPRAVAWDGLTYDYDSADIDVDGLDLYQFIQIFNPGDTEALAGFSEGFGSDPITVGRALLPCDAVDANQCFGKAVAASTDPDPVLRAFHSVTRIMALIDNSALNGLLTDLGVSEDVRTLCGWTADFTRDEAGDPVLPTTLPSTGTALNTVIDALMAEVQGALDELSGIVNSEEDPLNIVLCEELVLPEEADSCEKIEVDYGDIALYRAFLQGLKAFLLILDAYDLDIAQTTQLISALEADNFISINDYLSVNTGFLTLDTENGATQLTDAKAALYLAIESYKKASGFIQAETDDQDNDLIQFPEEQEEIDNEAEFMAGLEKIKSALSASTVIDSDVGISLDLTQFFDSAPDLRGFLPTFTNTNEIICETINSTLGGILTGLSNDDWAEILEIPVLVSGTVSLADGIGGGDGITSIIVQAYNCWGDEPSGLADLQWCSQVGSVSLSSGGDYEMSLSTEYDDVWMIAFLDTDVDSELSPGDVYGVYGAVSTDGTWGESFDVTSDSCDGPAGINISIGNMTTGIKGRVTTLEDGIAVPVTGIQINMYDSDSEYAGYITSVKTDSDGYFRIVEMSDTSVKLHVSNSGDQNFIIGWWNETDGEITDSRSKATSFSTDASDVFVDISLEKGASISGTVKTTGGSPIQDIWVYAWDWDTGDWKGNSLTDSNGVYTIIGLEAGNYRLETIPSRTYLSQSYSGMVEVTAGEPKTGIDFILEREGTITGTVTLTGDSGASLTDVEITAFNVASGEFASWTSVESDGTYTLSGLSSGGYKIGASYYPAVYTVAPEYYKEKDNYDDATPVDVEEGETVEGINFDLKVTSTSAQ